VVGKSVLARLDIPHVAYFKFGMIGFKWAERLWIGVDGVLDQLKIMLTQPSTAGTRAELPGASLAVVLSK
jgi:hypothetical protein